METAKKYYVLTKPGIIRGNLITAIAGFMYASRGSFSGSVLVALLAGVSLIIASGCVFNNYIDRDIDKKMSRTKKRALVVGSIKPLSALIYASLLGFIGFVTLFVFTNTLTATIGAIGFVSYVFVYGYAKRNTVHGTLVGSIPGSLSLVAGYTAVTGTFDLTAFLLFLIMAIWQMPHFYAIAIYRLDDYKAAGLPILSIKKGIKHTKVQIVAYIFLFGVACALLSIYSYAGYVYLAVMALVTTFWFVAGLKGFEAADSEKWAKSIFGISLLVLLIFSILLSVDNYLP